MNFFSANPGEDPKPLAKIISAGEMARVMLALKAFLLNKIVFLHLFLMKSTAVLSKTIQQVAQKMAELSLKHQIICVTHNHLVCIADHQYHLLKKCKKADPLPG